MKFDCLITAEATKYWKKAIKNDRVMIASVEGYVYIVNGFNAFKFPANGYIWDQLARAAFMIDMPADGAGVSFMRGEKTPHAAQDVKNVFVKNFSAAEKNAVLTPFAFDCKSGKATVQLYQNEDFKIIGVDQKYNNMINFSFADFIKCNGPVAPVCIGGTDGEFQAILLPMRLNDDFNTTVFSVFGGVCNAQS